MLPSTYGPQSDHSRGLPSPTYAGSHSASRNHEDDKHFGRTLYTVGAKPTDIVLQRRTATGEVKVKVHTLDIAPLRSESPPQKRSDVARVSRDLTVPAHPHVHLQSICAIPAFAFPVIAGTHLPTPEGWKAE